MKKLILASTLALFPLPALPQDQAEEDKGYLTRLIEDNLSGAGRDVNIIGFQGALSSAASLESMTISDEQGVWLTLENVVLDWNRSALLRGAISVEELSAERIIVARAPITGDTTAPTPEAVPFSLPELPVSVQLGALNIQRIELGESFLGEEIAVSLTGSASLADGEGTANIQASRLDGKEGKFIIDGAYDNVTTVLGLNLQISEGPGGIAAGLLGLPGEPAVDLTVAGTGPLNDYAADITLATDGQDRITGNVRLIETDGQSSFALNIGGDVTPLLVPEYQDFFGPDVALIAEGRSLPDGRLDLSTFDLSGQSITMNGSALIGAQGWPERLSLNGTIANSDGELVLLPLPGPKTYVDRVSLAVGYDANQSDDWSAEFNIAGFDRPGLYIQDVTFGGGGILRSGEGDATGEVTADFAYSARGLQLDDTGLSQALGDEITGVLQANRTEGQKINLTRLTLDGPGIEMAADAVIDGAKQGFRTAANVDLTVTALDRFSALAGRDLAGDGILNITATLVPLDGLFDVTVAGDTNDLAVGIAQVDPVLAGPGEIDVTIVRDTEGTRLEALSIATNTAKITAEADLTSGASDAKFDVSLTDVNIIVPELNGPILVTGTANRNDALITAFDVLATGPSARISATGTASPDGTGQSISATVQAQIADLATFSEIAGRDLDGAITANVNGIVLSDGMRFDIDLNAETQDLAVGVDQVDPLLAGKGTLSASLAMPRTGVYRVKDLAINTPALRLRADGNYDQAGPADAEFDFTLTDAGEVVANLNGPLSLRGTAARAADGSATVDVKGGGPGTTFALDAMIAAMTNEITGQLDARVADLSVYRDLADMPLAGSVTVSANGTALSDLSRFDGMVDLSSNNLAIGNPSVDPLLRGQGTLTATAAMTAAGLQVEDVNAQYPNMSLVGSLDSADGNGQGRFDARLRDIGLIADGISGPATAVGTANLNAAGIWAVDVDATAPGATINVDATIAADTLEVTGTANAAINDLRPYRTLAGQPISGGITATVSGATLPDLSRANADFNVTTSDLAIGNATVDQLLQGAGSLRGSIAQTGNGLSIRDFSANTPNVSLSGSLDGSAGAGRGQFEARLRDVGIFTDQLSGPVTASGTANLDTNGNWGINADGTGPGGITVRADGQYASSGNLNMDINGQLPLGLANAALEPRRLDGTATFDLAVNGPPALSSVSGRIDLNGARLTAPTLELALTDINGGVALSGNAAQLDITGQVSSGGSVSVTGPIALTGGYNADIAVRLNNAALRDPELYETSIDGTINVRGPLTGGAVISGILNLGPAEIQVPSSGVGSLGDLPNVTHIGADGAVRQTISRAGADEVSSTAGASTGGGTAYPLNLVINAPSRVFVRGRGLDAELGGTLTLGGTTANIVPIGQFDLIRGRLDILQQRFELSEGRASLQGDFEPYLRLVATTEARTGTVINIIVQGPASEPEVTFQSIPDLPQDEVLSQLIFGRDLADISPLQAVQLAAAVGTLAGRGGGGLIDTFRQNIGLDDFDVTTDEDGNAAVRAGAYLSENVYTDVTISSDGSTEVNINLDITDEITAKGTVDDDGETSIGIFFERDY